MFLYIQHLLHFEIGRFSNLSDINLVVFVSTKTPLSASRNTPHTKLEDHTEHLDRPTMLSPDLPEQSNTKH